ncbi:hypothetical protein X766_15990 [Mesorhizobium sp. LSJC255A00]|uniref:hypothetical protein n=1 Tax=Mesorhizobium sp. LSJC255A00 TaxID=1287313 RepID=UPI0003CE8681|nr:hypothetical protein [Mesorhizobium sp. LSJC255A00]ESX17891.1 hypothetical protein X766_15990 [Mesorhizobium sp. LSJC255A00]
MPVKAPAEFNLDKMFVAHEQDQYETACRLDPEPMVKDQLNWAEVRFVIRSLILVGCITIGTVMGVCAIYERTAHHQAIVCQEGC